jgi:hypothetical protein
MMQIVLLRFLTVHQDKFLMLQVKVKQKQEIYK